MDANKLINQLLFIGFSEDKSLLIADLFIESFPQRYKALAKYCGMLPWFDCNIIAELLGEAVPQTVLAEAVELLERLPFVEKGPNGRYFYHRVIHQVFLERYAKINPDELKFAFAKALEVWLKAWDEDDDVAIAALQGLLISEQRENLRERLDNLVIRFTRQGDWGKVIGLYKTLEKTNRLGFAMNLTVNDWVILGFANYVLEDMESALNCFSQAIALDSKNDWLYASRGDTHYELHNYVAALEDFSMALELSPNDAKIYNNRGDTYAMLGNYKASLRDLNQAITLDSGYALAYYNRGLAYVKLQDYKSALSNYAKAFELNPKDFRCVYNTACAYSLMGNARQACIWLRKSIAMDQECLQMARVDRDFDEIRNTDEFQDLVM